MNIDGDSSWSRHREGALKSQLSRELGVKFERLLACSLLSNHEPLREEVLVTIISVDICTDLEEIDGTQC